jgi:hypothetical protein
VWVHINNDLSGAATLYVFIWKRFGKGVDVICELAVVDVAGREKNSRFQERGDKLGYHPQLTFQLEGICSMKHNTEGYPIIDLDVALTEQVPILLLVNPLDKRTLYFIVVYVMISNVQYLLGETSAGRTRIHHD